MKIKSILTAMSLAGLAAASQVTMAGTIGVNYAGSANFGSGGVGYYTGSVAPNPNSSTTLVGVGLGGDSFTSANLSYDFSATGQFNTWCVDIYHWMTTAPVTYNVDSGGGALATVLDTLRPGTPSGAQRVTDLVALANDVYSTVDTKAESAAFQLAVWEITYGAYESGKYVINSTNTGFRVDSGTATASYGVLANQWLTNLGAAADTGNYKVTYLNDGTSNITQDMVVFTAVPEPGSIALLASGMLFLGFGRRKSVHSAIAA